MKYTYLHWKGFFLGGLIIANLFVYIWIESIVPRGFVSISYLNVGQGDAILIESTHRKRILIDGGPDKTVLRELGSIMSFFDRTIDIVIESHPDKDHIAGLPEVISRYTVHTFLEPGVESLNTVDDELKKRIHKKKIPDILARKGMIVSLGDGSELEILFPNKDVSGFETNDASIIARYTYGNTCFLFTGDAPQKIEEYLIGMYKEHLKCNVLKAGHHGSRTSTGDQFLHFVKPDIAIISAGKDNRYGHPHQEVLDRLKERTITVLSTIDEGTIRFVSDGKTISQK